MTFKLNITRKQTGEQFQMIVTDRMGFNRKLGWDALKRDDFRAGEKTLQADEEDFTALQQMSFNLVPLAEIQNRTWRDDAATPRQISYLRDLGVEIETGLTKGRASELIDAAKNRCLGSVNGFYEDGSN